MLLLLSDIYFIDFSYMVLKLIKTTITYEMKKKHLIYGFNGANRRRFSFLFFSFSFYEPKKKIIYYLLVLMSMKQFTSTPHTTLSGLYFLRFGQNILLNWIKLISLHLARQFIIALRLILSLPAP